MKYIYLLFIYLTIILVSCGPNQKEIERKEKQIADSIALVKKEQNRIHIENIEVGKSITKNKLTKILNELNSQLNKEKIELIRIDEFEFGRLMSTKIEQLRKQNKKINRLETFISKVENEISLTKFHRSFEFQLTPKGTIEQIFYSAKNNDFSKMRYLLDPYGKYDSDALQIYLIDMQPYESQQKWRDKFSNGRIIGMTDFTDNKIEYEIAIGPSSNRIEKIKLVQRIDKWYISEM